MTERSGASKDAPFSKRVIKANTVMQSRDAVKERRRDIFFKKVQQHRDDRRWANRGESILRLDFVATQKRWEAEKAREAPNAESDLDDYVSASWNSGRLMTDLYLPQDAYRHTGNYPEDEVDHILEQESRELDALISAMHESYENQDSLPQTFGSDDEDYDSLFMEFLSAQENQHRTPDPQPDIDDNAMDTSHG